jgi:hypothetical protein
MFQSLGCGGSLSWVGLKKDSNEVETIVGGFIVKVLIAGEVRVILTVFDQGRPWWEGNFSRYQSVFDAFAGPNIHSIRSVWAQVMECFGSHIFASAGSNSGGGGLGQPLAQAKVSQFNPPGR